MSKLFSVKWRSPSNIALVKYWGKKIGQIPANPSLSISLKNCYTDTVVSVFKRRSSKNPLRSFRFEGKENKLFEPRISDYITKIESFIPTISDYEFEIESENSFPHSSGIASSASSFSALALCFATIERDAFSSLTENSIFLEKASFLARLGSGSASRSVYPGYVLWGNIKEIDGSADEYAVHLNYNIHEKFQSIYDTILIVDESPKSVSSSHGHSVMNGHPFASARYKEAKHNLKYLLKVLQTGDFEGFAKIVEKEALTLHALMMSSDPGFILLKPATIEIIERVKNFRTKTNLPVTFTLDAGPNIHLLYPEFSRNRVAEFIDKELTELCSMGKFIDDKVGEGPVRLI